MTELFVAPEVARERMDRLVALVERHALTRHEARIGRIEQVLVEGPSKKDAARWSGRTRQNKLVHFPVDGHALRAGDRADVRVLGAAPHWLTGEVVTVTSAPRRPRVRIPVSATP